MAMIEEVLVPLYMHHRYQTESTATAVGGVKYTYAMRGDGLTPMWRVSASEQNQALDALMRTLRPSELTIPMSVINAIPPRPPGYGRTRELFPRYTGSTFDAITPAVVAASHTVNSLLAADRAARMVEQAALDPSLPSLRDVLGRLIDASFGATANGAYEAEVKRAVEVVVIDRIQWLAANAPMPQVRAVSTSVLRTTRGNLMAMGDSPHAATLAMNIQRFLDRPAGPMTIPDSPAAPPGAPIGQPSMDWLGVYGIGQPAMNWLGQYGPLCSWEDFGWR